ncbi:MAG: methyltransferase domain-containing protein, partial [Chitinophagia bacterium]|nr:methyltransferase domain-containing protein [Chitinophagia bacterium]
MATLRWKLAQFFEIIWWRRYLRGQPVDSYLADKKKYWNRILDSIAGTVTVAPGDTVIDMGCGPSGIYMMFPNNVVTAVDPLLNDYERDLDVFSQSLYPNVNFVTATIEDYTSNKTYDKVFCMNAINHVSDIEAGFRKLAELCAPRGKIIVTIDAHNNSLMKGIFRIGPGDVLHPHQY